MLNQLRPDLMHAGNPVVRRQHSRTSFGRAGGGAGTGQIRGLFGQNLDRLAQLAQVRVPLLCQQRRDWSPPCVMRSGYLCFRSAISCSVSRTAAMLSQVNAC